MENVKRWEKAQTYEKKHWKKIADNIAEGTRGQIKWYSWKADQFLKKLNSLSQGSINKDSIILEVGSGPIGMVSGLDFGIRYAVEPLGDYFNDNPILTEVRNPDVHYVTGCGESLSFEDKFFDLVIIDNVLDHTSNPTQVVAEAYRVLKDDGMLYIGINTRSSWGTKVHQWINLFNLDMGHPHEYTPNSIQQFLSENGFRFIWDEIEDTEEIKRKNLKDCGVKGKVKVFAGLTEYYYELFCLKEIYVNNTKS